MKPLLLYLFLLFSISLSAQKNDLGYFLGTAKTNSPLINRSKNESIIADLDLKQVRSILSKPEVNIESAVLFAPIISTIIIQIVFSLSPMVLINIRDTIWL